MTEDSGIAESSDDSEEAILTKMKCLAQDLEQKLSLDSNLVQEITQVCDNFEKKNSIFKSCTILLYHLFFVSDFKIQHLRLGRKTPGEEMQSVSTFFT